MKRFLKIGAVILGAVVLTTVVIDASDTLRGNSTTLTASLLGVRDESSCPNGMVHVPTAQTFSCVDMYEASPAPGCPFTEADNELATIGNASNASCGADAKADVLPWRTISREQAALVCARAGKRLPTANEWYQFAIGTPDTGECNTDTAGVRGAGASAACVSAVGAFDAIGNVWEWTSDDVIDGQYQGRKLPTDGYVEQVSSEGVATVTGSDASEAFGSDYFWSSSDGAYGLMRGGSYGSREDSGVYAVHARTLPTVAGPAIGFRCVR